MLAQSRLQVLDHFQYALLVALGEVLLDVHLAHGLREYRVGHRHGTLPARTYLLAARHGLAEELEVGHGEILAQVRCRIGDVVCRHVCAQILDGGLFEYAVHVVQCRGLTHDEVVELAYAQSVEIRTPVDSVVTRLQLFEREGVVSALHVAHLDVGPRLRGYVVLYGNGLCHDRIRIALDACEGQYLFQILGVGRLYGSILLVEVVVAVAHAQAALLDIEYLVVAVGQIGFGIASEE